MNRRATLGALAAALLAAGFVNAVAAGANGLGGIFLLALLTIAWAHLSAPPLA